MSSLMSMYIFSLPFLDGALVSIPEPEKAMCFVPIFIFHFRLACRCAKESGEKGYSHFGLQFYGECWSDPQADKRFDRYGKANGCIGFQYKKCDDEDLDNNECVGGGNKNYVYQIVGEGGKEKQSIVLAADARDAGNAS